MRGRTWCPVFVGIGWHAGDLVGDLLFIWLQGHGELDLEQWRMTRDRMGEGVVAGIMCRKEVQCTRMGIEQERVKTDQWSGFVWRSGAWILFMAYFSFMDPEASIRKNSRAHEHSRPERNYLFMVILMVDQIHIQEISPEYTVGPEPKPFYLSFFHALWYLINCLITSILGMVICLGWKTETITFINVDSAL